MDFPQSLMSKTNTYEVELFQGEEKIKTCLLYNTDDADHYTKMFKTLIYQKKPHIVGVDVKPNGANPELLILCIKSHCLVFQLYYLAKFPESLRELMADTNICFASDKSCIGACINVKLLHWAGKDSKESNHITIRGVDVGFLAARVFRNPDLCKERDGRKLGDAAGVTTVDHGQSTSRVNDIMWGASAFSDEQLKIAIHDAYIRFLIAGKLLGAVDEDHSKKKKKKRKKNPI